MNLMSIGWDRRREAELPAIKIDGLVPARVVREDRGLYRILGEFGELPAEPSGRLRHLASDRADLPAVGDWVAVRPTDPGGTTTIHGVLPRRSSFKRSASGTTSKEQVLAANVDVAYLVTGLDANFRLRRIERYVTLAHESGAEPVVVLSKADLADDVDLRVRQAEGVAFGIPVIPASSVSGAGIAEVLELLGPGRTGVFLGSSGVGKSTLVNRLLGADLHLTHEVREADGRGRHTTTRRELVLLPDDGGIVIDTPGLREIQLLSDGAGLEASFADVEEAAAACRFRDCRHEGEPGCGVAAALTQGVLDPDRYESYLEQRREIAYQARRTDERARQADEARWRKIAMDCRKLKKDRHGRR